MADGRIFEVHFFNQLVSVYGLFVKVFSASWVRLRCRISVCRLNAAGQRIAQLCGVARIVGNGGNAVAVIHQVHGPGVVQLGGEPHSAINSAYHRPDGDLGDAEADTAHRRQQILESDAIAALCASSG